jgi:hypothetical protein
MGSGLKTVHLGEIFTQEARGEATIFVSATRAAPASRQSTSGRRARSNSLVIQRKLAVGKFGDPFEREADMVADKVMRADASLVQKKPGCSCGEESSCSCDDSQTLHRKPVEIGEIGQHIVARAEDASIPYIPDSAFDPTRREEEESPESAPGGAPDLQRKESGAPALVSMPVEIAIGNARGGGEPLPEATRVDMEGRFGHDFRDVRVHADSRDGALAQRVNARAFTVGRDVFFAPGQYRPESYRGRHLLAHELTHVVQQRSGAKLVQRSEADTLAQCPDYYRYNKAKKVESYNCAGLAWRTYTYRGDLTAEHSAVSAGRSITCTDKCNPGEVKYWWWDYDLHGETTSGKTPSFRDFHTVAGVSDRAGNDPDDVYSKNGARPVYGPGTGPGFKPPGREQATTNDSKETPMTTPDGKPVYKVRTNFSELCACHPCANPPKASKPAKPAKSKPKPAKPAKPAKP